MPTPRKVNGNSKGEGGVQMPNFLKESMALKWSFLRGWWAQAKKPSMQGIWIYSGTKHCEDLPKDYPGKRVKQLES